MSKPKVYLSGPITGCTYEQATGWREEATRRLWPDIRTFSPMRGLEDKVGHSYLDFYQDHPTQNQQSATARDRFDVRQSDLILVNLLGALDRVSIGTIMEVAWADAFDKFIIVAMEGDDRNPHYHAMVRAVSSIVVTDLDEAIDLTRQVLLPDPEPPTVSRIPAAGDPFANWSYGPAVAFPAAQDEDLVRVEGYQRSSPDYSRKVEVSGYVRRKPKAS
jgi:hypothetical protein